jgi:hypothetical protein
VQVTHVVGPHQHLQANIAVRLSRACVDWASKLMDPIVNSSDITEIPPHVAQAALMFGASQGEGSSPAPIDWLARAPSLLLSQQPSLSSTSIGGASMSAPAAGGSPGTPTPPPPPSRPKQHPETVVRVLQGFAAPLGLSDMFFRQAGNHTGLDEVDDSLRSVLQVVSGGGRQ